MASDKKILASLDIDTKSLVKSTANMAEEIERLKDKQDKLIKKGKESSVQFTQNAAELSKLKQAYISQTEILAAYTNQEGKLISQKKAVSQAVNEVNKTENDYLSNNKELITLKKQLNSTDKDYEKRLEKINVKLQQNKLWLEENGSANAKLITTYNDFKNQVIDSFNSINVLNGGFGGLISRAQEVGGAGPLVKNALMGMTQGIVGMTKSAWTFVANPMGAILTAISLAVVGVVNAIKDFKPIMDSVSRVTAAAGAVFDSIKNSLLDLVNVFNGSKSIFSWFTDAGEGMASAAKEAYELKKAQQELADSMALQEIRNAEAKKSIEEYTKVAEDQTKSEQERLEALKKANEIESKNLTERKKHSEDAYQQAVKAIKAGSNLTDEELENLATKGYEYAQHLQETKSISQEEIDALKEAQLNRIALQTEEQQLTKKHFDNINNLNEKFTQKREEDQKKREQIQQQAMDKALERQQQLLDLFEAENSEKAKTLEQQIAYEQEYAKKSIALLKEELKQKKISQLEYKTVVINIQKELSEKTLESTHSFVNAQLELWKQENQSKLNGAQILTDELVNEEKARLKQLRDKQIEALFAGSGLDAQMLENKRANNEQLTQKETELYTELLKIRQGYDETIKANDAALVQSKKDEKDKEINDTVQAIQDKAAAEQVEYEVKKANAQTQYEEELIEEDSRHTAEVAKLQVRKAQGLLNEQQYNALLEAENEKNENNILNIKQAAMDRKLSLASSTFGNMSTILGKESKAGKAMAVAQATIDTYQSAVSAFRSLSGIPIVGPTLGAAAAGAAVATGLANIKKITSTKTPKAEKGALFSIGGKRHSAGGTMFTGEDGTRFEAEKGELIGVMNRNAARHFMAFNNTFPAGGGSSAGNYFESGGIVSREIAPAQINMQELANLTAQAVKSIPAPVVAVEDIINQGNSYVRVRESANF